jgi:outer membrane receptor protein involved in Fe transport
VLAAGLVSGAGEVGGRVVAASGSPLPGVVVEARGANGVTGTATSDEDGRYAIAELPAGSYQLSFQLAGFATSVRRDVAVQGGHATALHATLHLAATTEVVVTARRTFTDLSTLDPGQELAGIASAASSGVIAASQLEDRSMHRPADVLERVPGVVVSQHSGEGKANQYYVRGFNIDHGTDLALTVAGTPVNMPTNGHGQGYADASFLIPELIGGIQYKKGPYYAEEGDFSAAGAVNVGYLNLLDAPLAKLEAGEDGYRRALLAASPLLADGHLMLAFEGVGYDGPWVRPDDYRKLNALARYSRGSDLSGWSLTGAAYDGRWSSTDQVPRRATESGQLSRFGTIDSTDGGSSHRYSLSFDWQRAARGSLSRLSAYALDYELDLFSNFTYFLDDPERGDQFEQFDDRRVFGLRASHQRDASFLGRQNELGFGLQLRHDDIAGVGLYHTAARRRLETVREDSVLQTSGAAYVQLVTRWSAHVRTTLGLRGDRYRFDVDASLPANAGVETASLASPKLSLALGPWSDTELYLNFGYGFHSNDARGSTIQVDPGSGEPASRVDPLVRAKGAEIGVRTRAARNLHATATLWGLGLDSELLFVGDAGTTEASRPSRRVGFETTLDWSPRSWLNADASVAWSRARFQDQDAAGDRIPGSIEGVVAAGLSADPRGPWFGSLRARYFGPRALIEDNSVRSRAATLLSAQLGYELRPGWRLKLDVFNLLNAQASDVDYFYASRLPGEPLAGVDDVHTHPLEPRAVRFGISASF